jgi:hypothetical protein
MAKDAIVILGASDASEFGCLEGIVSLTAEKRTLDFKLVERPLDMLLTALGNKIEREWPKNLADIKGARELFLITIRVSEATYRSVRFICADKPPDPFRKPEYSISVPPLNRTILDSIFTVIFVFEDLQTRCDWYFKAGWRDEKLEFLRYQAEYGSLQDWQSWLASFGAHCDAGVRELGISAAEAAAPEVIESWPNPGRMVSYRVPQGASLPPTRQYLRYLNDWFYRDLSNQSHLGALGLMKRGGFLLHYDRHNPEIEAEVQKFKHAQIGVTLTLVLALASEVEAQLHFGLADRARYVWAILIDAIPLSKELYDKRYSELLAAA